MRVAEVLRGVPFDDVGRGKIIHFFADGTLCTGMKIYSAQGAKELEGVLFLGSHPTYKFLSLVFRAGEVSPWDQDVMLEFSDAILIPDLTSMTSGAGNFPSTGELALHDRKTLVRGELPSGTGSARYIDVETGQVFPSIGGQPVIISKWEIVTGTEKTSLAKFPNSFETWRKLAAS